MKRILVDSNVVLAQWHSENFLTDHDVFLKKSNPHILLLFLIRVVGVLLDLCSTIMILLKLC